MPELPEVQTVVSDLSEFLTGEVIRSIRINDEKVWFESELGVGSYTGANIKKVYRYGKYIVIKTSKGSLLVHLRMTGKLLPEGHSQIPQKLLDDNSKQIRAILETSAGKIIFYDIRRFGTITGVINPNDVFDSKKLAPEIYEENGYDKAKMYYQAKVNRSHKQIKATLLDQTMILGPGNIYADEALHMTGIHPEQKSSSLKPEEINQLFDNVVKVMNKAIEKRGTTAQNYLDFNGNPGVFKKYLNVYKRAGEACKSCNEAKINRIKVAGRSSHYCPNCQPYVAN